jgi:hypothetical protein
MVESRTGRRLELRDGDDREAGRWLPEQQVRTDLDPVRGDDRAPSSRQRQECRERGDGANDAGPWVPD